MSEKTISIIGGGAAGFFAALIAAEKSPSSQITIFEKTASLLTKVRISGGGRCNVTHACYEPHKLILNYPRGAKELLGPYNHFQPRDIIDWFERRNVSLKTEKDGRIFPTSNSSQTIIDCFLEEARKKNIRICCQHRLEKIERGFTLHFDNQKSIKTDCVLLATGGGSQGHALAASFGHKIIDPVPSLFTFNIPDSPFKDLSGISLPMVRLSIPDASLTELGPILITHFGLSGPCVLRLSAWGARYFHEKNYHVELMINWVPEHPILESLISLKNQHSHASVSAKNSLGIPKQLWKRLIVLTGFNADASWSQVSHKKLEVLARKIERYPLKVSGKTINKEEFVTAGGVDLKEIHFKTMESRLVPHLFFAGELLNIDGITGGFNFQNAWTTAYLAGNAIV